jgi:hypothetical protein
MPSSSKIGRAWSSVSGVGLLEDLVKLGARDLHTIGEVRRRYALARELSIDQLLVLILLAIHPGSGLAKAKTGSLPGGLLGLKTVSGVKFL